VKSAGSYIEKGAPVRVVQVGRFVIEVEEVDA
jgi:membrane-bound ClpP family serine protease